LKKLYGSPPVLALKKAAWLRLHYLVNLVLNRDNFYFFVFQFCLDFLTPVFFAALFYTATGTPVFYFFEFLKQELSFTGFECIKEN